MISAAIPARAINHPQMNASARRRPDGRLSKTIIVTTDTGLVNATANPSKETSAMSAATQPHLDDITSPVGSGSVGAQVWTELGVG